MLADFLGFSVRVWYSTSNPDNDVHNLGGFYADIGEQFWNTSTNTFFICTNNISGSMTWQGMTSQSVVQSLINSSLPSPSFSTPTFSSATTATRLSTTRSASVIYTFPTSMTTLITSQSLTATLQYADDVGMSTNLVTVNSDVQGCSGILSLTLSGRLQVQGIIPAGKYRRVVLSQSGGATVPTTLSSGQEVLL